MLIALRHEMHGTHIAYTDLEAKECEKNGWERDMALSEALSGTNTALAPEPFVVINKTPSLAEQYEAKFGKKPHHKMLPATIQAALDER